MSDTSSSSSGGIGICGLLGVAFVLAKIFEVDPVAQWSWWWVTAPFWGGLALVFGIMALCAVGVGLVFAVTGAFAYFTGRKRKKFLGVL